MEVFESELRLEVTELDIENGEIILKYPDSKNKKWQQEKKEELEKKYKIELEKMLIRENRDKLAKACFDFIEYRTDLDIKGCSEQDIFKH